MTTDDQRDEPLSHDPTGLDLARQLMSGVGRPPARKHKKQRNRRNVRSQPASRDPELVGAALTELITDSGWERQLAVQNLFGQWRDIVGEAIGQHSRPASLDGKVLTVRTDSTAWATQLRTIAAQLVAVLNEHLGQGMVERVIVKGPDAPNWKHGVRSVRDGRGPRDTYS